MQCSGQTTNINTMKFLPDTDQAEFLKNVINVFNLYFTIDVNNKTINFETYDVMFNNKTNPYDITSKVMADTVSIEYAENACAGLEFTDAENMKVLGDNQYLASSNTSALEVDLRPSDENTNKKVFNYVGNSTNTTDLGFGVPAIKRMYLRNNLDYAGADFNAGDFGVFIPNISKQTPVDNDNKNFNKNDADTNINNLEDTIQHKGNTCLYYYYGLSNSTLEQKAGVGYDKDYYYVNMDDVHQRFGVVSPFIYNPYRDNINERLSNPTDDADSVLASYVQTPLMMLGVDNTKTTDFSLVMSDNNDYGDTVFTRFHQNKYNRYRNGELLRLNMLMSNVDWQNMSVNQPIKYGDQIYSLVSINNYDVVLGSAEVVLVKQL